MGCYITLIRYTPEGRTDLKRVKENLKVLENDIKKDNGKIISEYETLGKYDSIIITETKDDSTLLKALMNSKLKELADTETLRAFSEEEAEKLIQ